MTEERLRRHHVEVKRRYGEVADVVADRHRLLQVLLNLVGNAIQAMEGRSTGRVLSLSVGAQDGRLRLAVEDNGHGISQENLVRIFNYGFTTKKDGHGFGLHSSANAVKEMKGQLEVESDGEGRGARFIVWLPLREEAPVSPASGRETTANFGSGI